MYCYLCTDTTLLTYNYERKEDHYIIYLTDKNKSQQVSIGVFESTFGLSKEQANIKRFLYESKKEYKKIQKAKDKIQQLELKFSIKELKEEYPEDFL